jgi:outer membrane protein, multidrug efflux system
VRISLIAEVTRIYLVLAADRENLQLAVSTLETQKASYDLVHKLFAAGVATELDLKQAQIPVETARRNLAISTQLVAQDLNALHLLAGSPVQEELLPPYLAAIASIPEISPGLSSDVLLQRPDIVAAEHRLKGTYAFIGAARAAFFPRIALTASIGTASDQLSGLFGSGADTWNFTPQIVMPIFDARTWAAYRVSETEREIALAHYEKTIQTAFREVADALAQRGTIDEQLAAQQALTDAAAESYRLSRIRYERGVDSYLAVLDSQRSLYSAQQVLIATRLARLDNLVTLYRVLGGGAM